MAGPILAAKPLAPLNPEHPLDGLGLGTVNTQGAALMQTLGAMPGAAEELAARQSQGRLLAEQVVQPATVAPAPQIIQQQMPTVPVPPTTPPTGVPGVPATDPAQAFNQQFNEQLGQPGAPEPAPEPSVNLAQDEYDFLVGLIQDQSQAIQGFIGGQQPAPGPTGIPVNGVVMPGAPAPVPPITGVKPLTVPEVAPVELSDAEWEKITTDKAAFVKYQTKNSAAVAAKVTEQISQNVLPTIYSTIQAENDKQRAIDLFLQNNPELAAHPQALQTAIREATVDLPYATPDRLMYHAGQKLKAAMGANNAINQNVHDLRGTPARRAPVMNQGRPLRVAQETNLANANPFTLMRDQWIQEKQTQTGDILQTLGIGQQR